MFLCVSFRDAKIEKQKEMHTPIYSFLILLIDKCISIHYTARINLLFLQKALYAHPHTRQCGQ